MKLLKRLTDQKRFARGKAIPDSVVRRLEVSDDGRKVSAFLSRGGGDYFVLIDAGQRKIFHYCPDWEQSHRFGLCKHIVKVFLMLPEGVAERLLESVWKGGWTYETNPRAVQVYHSQAYMDSAIALLRSGRTEEAIQALLDTAFKSTSPKGRLQAEAMALELALEHWQDPLRLLELLPRLSTLLSHRQDELAGVLGRVDGRIASSVPNLMQSFGFPLSERLRRVWALVRAMQSYPLMETRALIGGWAKQAVTSSKLADQVIGHCLLVHLKNLPSKLAQKVEVEVEATPEQKRAYENLLLRTLRGKLIYFAEQEELEPILNALQTILPFTHYSRLIRGYEQEKAQVEKAAYRRKAGFLIGFIRRHRLQCRFRLTAWEDLVYISKPKTDEAIDFVLRKCGLEGRVDYLDAQHFVTNYPTLLELSNGADDWNLKEHLWRQVEDFWGSQNPSITPVSSEEEWEQGRAGESDLLIEPDQALVVEWDLLSQPRRGSIVGALHGGILLLPDPTVPLAWELLPFEMTLCHPQPLIATSRLHIVRPLQKLSLKAALKLIDRGARVLCTYRPLDEFARLCQGESFDWEVAQSLFGRCQKNLFAGGTEEILKAIDEKHLAQSNRTSPTDFETMKASGELPDLEKLERVFGETATDVRAVATSIHAPNSWREQILREAFERATAIDEAQRLLREQVTIQLEQAVLTESPNNPVDLDLVARTAFKTLLPKLVEHRQAALCEAEVKITKRGYDISALKQTTYGAALLRALRLHRRRYISAAEFTTLNAHRENILSEQNLTDTPNPST